MGISLLLTVSAVALPPANYRLETDWLLDGRGFKARVEHDEASGRILLTNGLLRRVFRVDPGFSTVGYDNLATGESIIQAIRPDARVVIDGREHLIGGMTGQPNQAFFTEDDLAGMEFDPAAMRLVGVEEGKPVARFAWKQVRHHAPDAAWPPAGVVRSPSGWARRTAPALRATRWGSRASWSLLLAASGFRHHGPKGEIGFDPKLGPEMFRCPFTAAEGWGTFEQKKEGGKWSASLKLRHGKLRVRSLSLPWLGGEGEPVPRWNGREISRSIEAGQMEFKEGLVMVAGDVLALG